jgi:hypothetical protein
MSSQKNNRPQRNPWLPVIAGAALIISGVYTAWLRSEQDPTLAKSALNALLGASKSLPSLPSAESFSVNTPNGNPVAPQQFDPLLDPVVDALADARIPGAPTTSNSQLQTQSASHPKQPARADAEFIDDGPREIVMEPAAATVTLDGVSKQLEPNVLGCFPRMLIATEGRASVLVSYPNATPGAPLVIQCEDGGTLDNGLIVKRSEVDTAGRVSFQFSAGVPEGIYRILIRKGLDEKHLEFWAGPELALKPLLSNN